MSPSPVCEVVAVFLFWERGSEIMWAVGAGRGWLREQLGFRPEPPRVGAGRGCAAQPCPAAVKFGFQPQTFRKD